MLIGDDPVHPREHQVERDRHRRDVHGQRQHQTAVLADDELPARQRLGEQAVDAAPLDLARDQPDADEHRHQHAGQLDRRQAQVLDDLDVLPRRDLPDQHGRRDQQQRERADRVQHAIAHALLEHVQGDDGDAAHRHRRTCWPGAWGLPPGASALPSALRNASSSVVPQRRHGHQRRARGREVADDLFRPHVRPDLEAVAAVGDRGGALDARAEARDRRLRQRRDDDLPAAMAVARAGGKLGHGPRRDQAALRENADAAAELLGVGQDVRAEEHRAALVAQPEDQLAHFATADRIETRHRLVEHDELGIVDERLREPDALDHALRVLRAAAGADRRPGRPDRARAPRARGAPRPDTRRDRRSTR